MTRGPYADTAWQYWAAGWRGVLPVGKAPGAKSPPPDGYTGWAGVEPSGADVQAWIDGPEGARNIALRLPRGAFGLDVDAYNGKRGGEALRAAEASLGALPPTWVLTSRDDGVSGIRLYRAELPPGRRWRDEPAGHGVGIEAIHYGHRYAVTWPSIHPDTGAVYRFGPPGHEDVPRPNELPRMPDVWIEALSEPGEVSTGEAASHAETLTVVEAMPVGEACMRMRDALERAMARLRQAVDGAALHPAARDATHEIVSLGWEGHADARRALAEHYSAHVAVRVGRGGDQRAAEGEWWRLVRGAVGKLPAGAPREGCDCAALSGAGLLFERGEAGSDDTSGATGQTGDDTNGGEGGVGGVEDLVGALIAEMVTFDELSRLPPPRPLVHGLLDLETLSWLIGKSGSRKSFLALDLAARVSLGWPWAGRKVEKGRVVYVCAEGAVGARKRARAWQQHYQAKVTDVWILQRPVMARDVVAWHTLVCAVTQIQPVLIVIDTQARVATGIEENSNTEMGAFIEQAAKLRDATRACVLLIHHIGRNGEDARGASSIDAAQDAELTAEKLGKASDLRGRVKITKQKDEEDGSIAFEYSAVSVDMGTDEETGKPITSLVIVPDAFTNPLPGKPWLDGLAENQARLLDVLHEHFGELGATSTDAFRAARERFGDIPRTTLQTAWKRLAETDHIAKIHGTQRWVSAALPERET